MSDDDWVVDPDGSGYVRRSALPQSVQHNNTHWDDEKVYQDPFGHGRAAGYSARRTVRQREQEARSMPQSQGDTYYHHRNTGPNWQAHQFQPTLNNWNTTDVRGVENSIYEDSGFASDRMRDGRTIQGARPRSEFSDPHQSWSMSPNPTSTSRRFEARLERGRAQRTGRGSRRGGKKSKKYHKKSKKHRKKTYRIKRR